MSNLATIKGEAGSALSYGILNPQTLDEYIRETGPFSLTIRPECRVVTHVIEGDYVVCQEGKERVWRRVEK